MIAGVANEQQAQSLRDKLFDPDKFYTDMPFAALAKDDSRYSTTGNYWKGGVWAPTNYMVIKGLDAAGLNDDAQKGAQRYIDAIDEVFKNTGTFWENYASTKQDGKYLQNSLTETGGSQPVRSPLLDGVTVDPNGLYFSPGITSMSDQSAASVKKDDKTTNMVKYDFVGWTGNGPISFMIEDVLGITPDTPDGQINWDLKRLDENGIKRLGLGEYGDVSFVATKRDRADQGVFVTVDGNVTKEFTLNVTLDGTVYHVRIPAGEYHAVVPLGFKTAVSVTKDQLAASGYDENGLPLVKAESSTQVATPLSVTKEQLAASGYDENGLPLVKAESSTQVGTPLSVTKEQLAASGYDENGLPLIKTESSTQVGTPQSVTKEQLAASGYDENGLPLIKTESSTQVSTPLFVTKEQLEAAGYDENGLPLINTEVSTPVSVTKEQLEASGYDENGLPLIKTEVGTPVSVTKEQLEASGYDENGLPLIKTEVGTPVSVTKEQLEASGYDENGLSLIKTEVGTPLSITKEQLQASGYNENGLPLINIEVDTPLSTTTGKRFGNDLGSSKEDKQSDTVKSGENSKYPSTGNTSNANMVVTGLLMLFGITSSGFAFKRKHN